MVKKELREKFLWGGSGLESGLLFEVLVVCLVGELWIELCFEWRFVFVVIGSLLVFVVFGFSNC